VLIVKLAWHFCAASFNAQTYQFCFETCFLQLLSASLEQFVQEVEARSLLFVSVGLFCSRS
jgi:hypothetical protein